jgi:hypothetical protein
LVKITVKIGTIFDIPKNILTNLINENNQLDYNLNKNPQPIKARGCPVNQQTGFLIILTLKTIIIKATTCKIPSYVICIKQ